MNRRQLLQSLTVASGLTATVAACRTPPGGTAGSEDPAGAGSGEPVCYTSDWKRTEPDLVLYLPEDPPYASEANDHVLVEVTPGGDLLAIWTLATKEGAHDNRVVYARSKDDGVTWTRPQPIAAPEKLGTYCNFGWPVVSKSGRIYVFYNFAPGIGEGFINAVMCCKFSDDDGYTWQDAGIDMPYKRNRKYDHPGPDVLSRCIVWQKPIRDAKDRPVVPLTRSTAAYVKPFSKDKNLGECRCEFIRYENIDEGPHPRDLELTYLPEDEDLIWVPCTFEPEKSQGYTFCQEPGTVLLPDGRLFAAMRTANGQVWYTVSDDAEARTWRKAEMLRYRDGGKPVENPVSPTPMFRLSDGRFLLFIQNHDGTGYGGKGPLDLNARRPQFFVVGEYRPKAHQPVWFSRPKMIFDTHATGVFPKFWKWLSMYASFTEHRGKRILWYADRKIFVLGRHITDEMLADMTVPRA
ncbi:MAG: hypothetical protein F4Z21_04670 [Acidobacteria bacterium]|nr:hypothetical protein [Acidobacteriota bacterium]